MPPTTSRLMISMIALAALNFLGMGAASAQSVAPVYPPNPLPLSPTVNSLQAAQPTSRAFGPRFLAPAPVPRPSVGGSFDPLRLLTGFAPAAPAVRSVGAAAGTCAAQLAALGVAFEQQGRVDGPGACGVDDAVQMSRIGGTVLTPAATVSCPTAAAFARFFHDEIAPAARQHLRAEPQTVHVAASYVCRTRNNQPGARMSEHSFGRAIDVRAITFANGQSWHVAPRLGFSADARFQRHIRQAACGPFKTVLGPGSDGFHTDHLHFDLAQRRSTYCR